MFTMKLCRSVYLCVNRTLASKQRLNPVRGVQSPDRVFSVWHHGVWSKIVLSVWESPRQTENMPGKRSLYTWEGKTTLKSMLGYLFSWKQRVSVHVCARQGFSCRKHVDGVYMHQRSVSWFGWGIVPEKHPWLHTGSLSWFSLLAQPPLAQSFSNFFLSPALLF